MVNRPLAYAQHAPGRFVTLLLPLGIAAGILATFSVGLGELGAVGTLHSEAAIITVTTTDDELNDDGDCSLREAIQAANTNSAIDACAAGTSTDRIDLPAGIYVLTRAGAGEDNNATGDLDVAEDVTLNGVNRATTIIDANGLDRAVQLLPDNATLMLSNITVRNGHLAVDLGGGLYANGPAIVSNTIFLNNVTQAGSGGGAAFYNTAAITGTVFQSNTANFGGGAYFYQSAAISNSTFLSNTAHSGGGGAHFESELFASKVTVAQTLFQGNTVPEESPATFSVIRGAFPADAAGGGGGAVFDGSVMLADTTFISNTASHGGGAYFYSEYFNTNQLTVMRSLFLNNTANDGGGVYVYGFGANTSDFVNTLFAANQAVERQGAALYSADSCGTDIITLRHATIASPTVGNGSAVVVRSGTLHITNTIVASYTIGLENAAGSLSEDHTLFFGVTSPITGSVTGGHSSIYGAPAFVDPAHADYHLTRDSAAIDAGINAGVSSDFENDSRPQGTGYDIGYDESPFTLVPIRGLSVINSSPTSVGHATQFTATLLAGSGVRYAWDFGDNSWCDTTSSTVSHTYQLAGNYSAIVTATNSVGSMNVATPVTVTEYVLDLPLLVR